MQSYPSRTRFVYVGLHIRREASIVFLPLAGIAKPLESVKSKQLHAFVVLYINVRAQRARAHKDRKQINY